MSKSGAKDASSAGGFEKDTRNRSGPGSAIPSSDNSIKLACQSGKEDSGLAQQSSSNSHIPRRKGQQSFSNAQIPTRKRSVLKQCIVSPVDRLHRQLHHVLQEPEFSKLTSEQEDVLIFGNNQNSSGEIGLGCVLLAPTASSKDKDKE